MDPQPDELDFLHRYLDGTISKIDFDPLQNMLRKSYELRKALRDLATVDAKLIEMAAAGPVTLPASQSSSAPLEAVRVKRGGKKGIPWWIAVPLAAGLLLGAIFSSTIWGHAKKQKATGQAPAPAPVRAAVVGALTNTGLWDTISKRFEKATGRKVFISYTGDHELCEESFRKGYADVLAIHGGDDAERLISEGIAVGERPWAYAEMVISGPSSDPAGIRGLASGAEALKRIAAAHSPFFEYKGSGSAEIAQALWTAAGIGEPSGDWVLKDTFEDKKGAMHFAEERGAYLIVGGLPIHSKKLHSGKMAILVKGDPAMRRTYVILECNAARFPEANASGAHALAQFLVSPEIQQMLSSFGAEDYGRTPYFPPVQPPASGKLSMSSGAEK